MSVREIPDQKRLATLMRRSEGAVSKKLGRPETIDMAWLSEFAAAFQTNPADLFSDPTLHDEAPPIVRPRLAELMSAAADADDVDLDYLISVLSRAAKLAPPEAPSLEHAAARSATSKSK